VNGIKCGKLAEVVTLLSFRSVWDVSRSSLKEAPVILIGVFYCFLQAANALIVPSARPRPLPFTLFPVYLFTSQAAV
jgi:hypothetical protein